ncbi:MAG: Asp-tRNA(Asn)/Glu-tRNA(Gln) amidotransferase subunit GatA [Candidatus Omnitrophica bacterium]|nr:Asp-tRNA(Asn)/Glu-tRNA(Gln) amidotransferase subunit GatA [Candidatus Omnitrophota bacterium]
MTASETLSLYKQGKATPTQVAEDLIRRIQALEPKLHCFASFDPESVRRQAKELEQKGKPGSAPLWGVPVLVKDNICVKGTPTTCCSKILSGFRPPYDATVVERLKRDGAILLGMANMDEFAFGSSCEHSCYGPTRNPWDTQRVPGGSSGGSAAAVAAGLCVLALGSDTGGSIRQPASFCGVAGLKPTYGRVSRYGLVAFASSLDQIGPITRTVGDAALLLQTLAGFDERDSTSANVPTGDYVKACGQGAKGLRVGVPKEYLGEGIDPEVASAVRAAIARFEKMGCSVKELSMPHTPYAVPTYYIVATAEASSNLARFDGVRYGHRAARPLRQGSGQASPGSGRTEGTLLEMYTQSREQGFGPEAKRRITLGTFVLSSGYYDAYYGRALKVRTLIQRDFNQAFEQVDVLVTPTAPTPPFKLGEKLEDPLTMYLSDILTISVNLAGVPALSVPCGFTGAGLPIGLQLIAKPFGEETLFRAGSAYEQATDWHKREPKL